MHAEAVIDVIEDISLESRERSRALEFLASAEDTSRVQLTLQKYLRSDDPLMRESAVLGSLSHIGFEIYNILLERFERKDELDSIKESISVILDAWTEQWPDEVRKMEKMRDEVLNGS